MSDTFGTPKLAQPGIFRGHVLSTSLGFVPPAKQAAIVQFIQVNDSLPTAHEVQLVIEGRKPVNELSETALAEMRRLTTRYLRR